MISDNLYNGIHWKTPILSLSRKPCMLYVKRKTYNDETLPIINKPKHPKKGGIQGTKWKDLHPRRQKNHLKG